MNRAGVPGVVMVWTTFPADGDPAPLMTALVKERLAACVTVQTGVRSVYRWNDAVEEAIEQQLVIKTTADRVEQVRERIGQAHPYELPELLVVPADGAPAYLEWVRASTRVEESG